MNLLAIFIAFAGSALLTILTLRIRKPGERLIIMLIYYTLQFLSALIIASQLLGVDWHPYIQIGAFMYATEYSGPRNPDSTLRWCLSKKVDGNE